MAYKYDTPYKELSGTLKKIHDADNSINIENWNNADTEERIKIIETVFAPLNLKGTLTIEELDYLSECNYHILRSYLETFT